jgi:hypothetical protein
MAKTLVGLYDTAADAEYVVQALVDNGFSRSDILLTTCEGVRAVNGSSARGRDLIDTLTELGIPVDEANMFAEGVDRGGALVVVQSNDEWSDRGTDTMNRLHPVDIHARAAQWRGVGWTGFDANATQSNAANVPTEMHQEQRQRNSRVKGKKKVTVDHAQEHAAHTSNKRRRIGGRTASRKTSGSGKTSALLEKNSQHELYSQAKALNIPGRSKMNKGELIKAIHHVQ